MQKVLEPIQEDLYLVKDVELAIEWVLNTILIKPLLDIIDKQQPIKTNSVNYLKEAIESNLITYNPATKKFTGSLSASITTSLKKLGATFDGDGFVLENKPLPRELEQAYFTTQRQNELVRQQINNALNSNELQSILNNISFTNVYHKLLDNVDKQFATNARDVVSIKPVYTPAIKNYIAENYSNNLKLYIKDFTEDKIVALRKHLEPLILENGYRSSVIQEYIEKSFDVNKSKAKFLARQESSLLTTSYTEARYQENGITSFIWSSSGDSRTRPEHKLLNGKEFSFSNPPIIDVRTGQRGLPGEAFGCRCRMKPVVKLK
jgi:SPP1 gp7 family putative phage head morphogenesis protein